MVKATVAACKRTWTHSTFKRELAVLLWAFMGTVILVYMVRIFIFTPSDPAMVTALANAFSAILSTTVPVIGMFSAMAFGLDAWSKQIQPPKVP